MKIKRFQIKNITSYRDRTEFFFDRGINILIGPNGGGKSNLQKTLALVLSKYFILQYDFRRNDQETKIERIDFWNRRVLERSLARFVTDPSDQEIEIELEPEASDTANMRAIGENLARFNEELEYWESPPELYEPLSHLGAIEASASLTYRIVNFELQEPPDGTPEWAFMKYLNTFFKFMRLSTHIEGIRLTSPVFFFFSQRHFDRSVEIQPNDITEQSYYSGFRSAYEAAMGENTNLLQWGARHFARLYWKALNDAAAKKDAVAWELYALEPDVKLLSEYLLQLGYRWDFLTDQDRVSFVFALLKGGMKLTANMFSSGEREIVHFLLAMFALNVKDGVILVDEPELHLHPSWQRIFLGLFRDLAPSRNNQFILATHSPVFVTPDTVNDTTRIFRAPDSASRRIALKEIELLEKKSLVRMINSQNNERVFFADKAILVEGITDRLVLASLLDGASALFANNEAIEIVEVGGKASFADYRLFLGKLETPCFVVADLDYLTIIGSDTIPSLFVADQEKVMESLKDKKGLDARKMIETLDAAVRSGDTSNLGAFLDYLRSRHRRLKAPLTEAEQTSLDFELGRLSGENVLVLRCGEIEDYLPPGVSGVKAIVELIADRNWINRVDAPERRVELAELARRILGVEKEKAKAFLEQARAGNVAFPQPISQQT